MSFYVTRRAKIRGRNVEWKENLDIKSLTNRLSLWTLGLLDKLVVVWYQEKPHFLEKKNGLPLVPILRQKSPVCTL